MALLITGGGTGGHLAIALAFGEELNRRGVEVVYVGSVNGQDRQWFGNEDNSSLGNQFGKSSCPASLRRMSNTPHSQDKTICQSTTANARIVGESGVDFSQNNIDFSENNNPPSPNCQNVAEGATNDKKSPPSLAERGLKGRVKSTLESSPKSSLESNAESSLQADLQNPRGTSPQLRSSDSVRKREWAQLRKQNPQNTKITCHANATFDKNANSRNDAKKQSLANKIKSELKAFFTQFLPAMLGSSTAQIASFIDTILASFLASGSISYLYYANRIFQLPLAIFAIAISTALFPMVAKSIKAGQEANALKSMKKSFWFLCFMLLACAIGGAMLNQHIIWLLYEHGKFSRADTIECALVFAGYMVGLVPFGLARIFSLYLYVCSCM